MGSAEGLSPFAGSLTVNPASALGMEDAFGSLAVGRAADVTVLEEHTGDWVFHDTEGQTLAGSKALVPALTVKEGEIFTQDWGPRPWGWLPDTDAILGALPPARNARGGRAGLATTGDEREPRSRPSRGAS